MSLLKKLRVLHLLTRFKEGFMGEEKRSERVAVRLTPSLKEAVTELASRENRSLSNYIELLLSEKVESIKK
nr:MAG TPA: hypothetical protein [Caudoviricetes sp.]